MMQVKYIEGHFDQIKEFESAVNSFLKEHDGGIEFWPTVSHTSDGKAFVAIWYEEAAQ